MRHLAQLWFNVKTKIPIEKTMKISELPIGFRTPRGISLPSHDEFGIPHGIDYEAHQKARTVRLSTRSTFRGLKFHRRFEALSMNETRALFGFAFNPYVVDIRDQYPMYRTQDFNRATLRGARLLKTQVMAIDIVLTIVLPPGNNLHNHCVNIKGAGAVLSEKDERRFEGEISRSADRSWTWELLRGDVFSMRQYANHWVLYRSIRDTNVFLHYDAAETFAAKLARASTRGTFDLVVRRVSQQLDISPDFGHKLFAVAVSFGFIHLDPTKDLRVDSPLYLLRI